jgi:UDP-glucose 4-epimerase
MNILITGGGGFLGVHLADALISAKHNVTLYDLRFSPKQANQSRERTTSNLELVHGDIRDEIHLKEIISKRRIEQIIHLAALLTEECEGHPARGVDINCRGSAVVFEAAIRMGVARVIFGSSVAVFNNDPSFTWGDDRPYGPVSLYGISKVFVEQLADHLNKANQHTSFLGLRFGWIYGPGRDRGWREVQAMIEGFARGDKRVRYPDYHAPMDWTYVEDAVQAVTCVLTQTNPGDVPAYNVCGDYRSVQDAVAYLLAKFPHVKAIPYAADLPPVGWQFQNERICTVAGFTPGYRLETGLEKTLERLQPEFHKKDAE